MITFYEQARGSSHIASGKPCQDNGLHYNKNGVQIAIVCDGHGGDSYVRSQRGSYIAAKVALENIQGFINSPKSSLLINKKGAVTSKPLLNPLKGKNGERIEYHFLSESQQELVKQNKSYIDESSKNVEIENNFRELFAVILQEWRSQILDDSKSSPFNKYEKEKLGSKRIEKAYGTTLMAAVRTKDYWFAFHIGDGKLLACNHLMEWNEPVPWDCNCFLNTTTSLCDSNPIEEFRYAFDGTGNFPLAFVLGSDGIDDTYIKKELLHKFYSQLLCVFEEFSEEEALCHLRNHLPILSAKGSHDDMSVAGIIDSKYLKKATQYYSIISERTALNHKRSEKEQAISILKEKIIRYKKELSILKQEHREFSKFIWNSFIDMLKKRTKDKLEEKAKRENIEKKESLLIQLDEDLKRMEFDFDEWRAKGREKILQLKEEAEILKGQINNEISEDTEDLTFDISEKSASMDIVNESPETITSSPLSKEENELIDKEAEEQTKEIMNKQ